MSVDPPAGYAAVRAGAGVAERADRVQLRLRGREPVKMVQGLITNDLAGAAPGTGVYGAMLTPKGRVITELRAFTVAGDSGVEVVLDLPRETVGATVDHLRKFVPPMFARCERLEGSGALGVYGPRSRALLSSALGEELPPLAEDAFAEIASGGAALLVVGTRYAGGEDGYDVIAEVPALERLREALVDAGAEPVSAEALEALRIEAGRPRGGYELTEETIATEAFEGAGLMGRAISFGKGCYTGQEVIVRIAHRGHVNRSLRGLRLGREPAPAAGTPIFLPDGKEVGRLTSAADSPRLEETIALGFVRREVVAGQLVRVGSADGADATVVTLPFGEQG